MRWFHKRQNIINDEVWPDVFKEPVDKINKVRGLIFYPDERFNPETIDQCEQYIKTIATSNFSLNINDGDTTDRFISRIADVLLHEMIDVVFISEFYTVSKNAIIEEAAREVDSNPEAFPVRDEVIRRLNDMKDRVIKVKNNRGDFIADLEGYADNFSKEIAEIYVEALENVLYSPLNNQKKEYIKEAINIVFMSYCKFFDPLVSKQMRITINSLDAIIGEINSLNDIANKKIAEYNKKEVEL